MSDEAWVDFGATKSDEAWYQEIEQSFGLDARPRPDRAGRQADPLHLAALEAAI
jgi:hypothetical protein